MHSSSLSRSTDILVFSILFRCDNFYKAYLQRDEKYGKFVATRSDQISQLQLTYISISVQICFSERYLCSTELNFEFVNYLGLHLVVLLSLKIDQFCLAHKCHQTTFKFHQNMKRIFNLHQNFTNTFIVKQEHGYTGL